MDIKHEVARSLLSIEAVFLRPQEPFTWASGIKSPIYCDNRLILPAPEARDLVERAIAETVRREYPQAQVLMGTATAGIAHAAIAAHLLGHGRRRAAMLFGDEAAFSDQRVMGWVQAHRDLGLPAGPIYQSDFTREGAYQITADLLTHTAQERPDAIFAASDLEALGALRAIHEAGLRVPEDIALISFDGTAETLYTWPQLTTMKQDTMQIARCAIDAALRPDTAPDVQLVPAKLIVRRSCGCR